MIIWVEIGIAALTMFFLETVKAARVIEKNDRRGTKRNTTESAKVYTEYCFVSLEMSRGPASKDTIDSSDGCSVVA